MHYFLTMRSFNATSKTQGFTLIELLVVIIIVGVLAAVSIPNLIAQISKARETEARSSLGTISRGQKAYHYQHGTFYNGSKLDLFLNADPSDNYYSFTGDPSANKTQSLHTAYAIDPDKSPKPEILLRAFILMLLTTVKLSA